MVVRGMMILVVLFAQSVRADRYTCDARKSALERVKSEHVFSHEAVFLDEEKTKMSAVWSISSVKMMNILFDIVLEVREEDAAASAFGLMWGISETGAAVGSDVLNVTFTNGVSPSPSPPSAIILDGYINRDGYGVDAQQDWTMRGCGIFRVESDNVSLNGERRRLWVFASRSLDTKDRTQDRIMRTKQPSWVVFATTAGHSGSTWIDLGQRSFSSPRAVTEEGLSTTTSQPTFVDIGYDTIIPDQHTTVWCKSFDLSTILGERAYASGFVPIVDQTEHVHHMHLHWCSDNAYHAQFREQKPCLPPSYDPDREKTQCRGVIFTYTPGGARGIHFPVVAGLPLADAADSMSLTHVIVEIHYDNPKLLVGLTDATKIRIPYQTTPRKHLVGLLQVADPFAYHTPENRIPGRSMNYEYVATCPRSCTETWPAPLHLFYSLHHMHLIGQSIWTSALREDGGDFDVEEVIHKTEYYEHDFQHFSPVNFTLKPGDRIRTHCIYRNEKAAPVKIGAETSDEMCMNMFYYYPRIDFLMMCGLGPQQNTVLCNSPANRVVVSEDIFGTVSESTFRPLFGAIDRQTPSSTDVVATTAPSSRRGLLPIAFLIVVTVLVPVVGWVRMRKDRNNLLCERGEGARAQETKKVAAATSRTDAEDLLPLIDSAIRNSRV